MTDATLAHQPMKFLKAHQRVVVVISRGGPRVGHMPVEYVMRINAEDDEPVLVCLRLQCMQEVFSVQVCIGSRMQLKRIQLTFPPLHSRKLGLSSRRKGWLSMLNTPCISEFKRSQKDAFRMIGSCPIARHRSAWALAFSESRHPSSNMTTAPNKHALP